MHDLGKPRDAAWHPSAVMAWSFDDVEPRRKWVVRAGDRFGDLTVMAPAGRNAKGRYVRVLCSCGVEKIVCVASLADGSTVSCGHYRQSGGQKPNLRHGHRSHGRSPTYSTWRSMHDRCSRKGSIGYQNYGGRGIRVCAEWDSFDRFLADMGPRPDGHTLDRIDTQGNYEPGNCRWATLVQQARNRPDNKIVTLGGVSKCATEWAQEYGLDPGLVINRITRLGWPPIRALTTPPGKNGKKRLVEIGSAPARTSHHTNKPLYRAA